MANHKDKRTGECLARIGLQARELYEYIFDEKKNGGRIGLKELIEMSNVIVSNIELLRDLDKKATKSKKGAKA